MPCYCVITCSCSPIYNCIEKRCKKSIMCYCRIGVLVLWRFQIIKRHQDKKHWYLHNRAENHMYCAQKWLYGTTYVFHKCSSQTLQLFTVIFRISVRFKRIPFQGAFLLQHYSKLSQQEWKAHNIFFTFTRT